MNRNETIKAAEKFIQHRGATDDDTEGDIALAVRLLRSLLALVPKEGMVVVPDGEKEKIAAFDYLIREDILPYWIDEIPYLDDDCPEIIKAAREEK